MGHWPNQSQAWTMDVVRSQTPPSLPPHLFAVVAIRVMDHLVNVATGAAGSGSASDGGGSGRVVVSAVIGSMSGVGTRVGTGVDSTGRALGSLQVFFHCPRGLASTLQSWMDGWMDG